MGAEREASPRWRDAPDASSRLMSFSVEGWGSRVLLHSSWHVHRWCRRSVFVIDTLTVLQNLQYGFLGIKKIWNDVCQVDRYLINHRRQKCNHLSPRVVNGHTYIPVYWVVLVVITLVSCKYSIAILSLSTKCRGGLYVGCDNFSHDYTLLSGKVWPHCRWGVGGGGKCEAKRCSQH